MYSHSPDPPPSSPKRKLSSASTEASGSQHKKASLSSNSNNKRRKVNHACVYCRRSHMTCDLERPCARCVKRDIGHLCHDEPREPPKRNGSEMELAVVDAAAAGVEVEEEGIGAVNRHANGNGNGNGRARLSFTQADVADYERTDQQQQRQPSVMLSPTALRTNSLLDSTTTISTTPNLSLANTFDWGNTSVQNQFQDMHHLHPNYMFNHSEVTNEYNLLNDFLSTSLLDDGALYADSTNDSAQQTLYNDPLLNIATPLLPPPLQQPTPHKHSLPPPSKPDEISRPGSAFPISDSLRNTFYLTAADPAGTSSAEDRLHKLLKAKYDAGMLKPFNYVRGYARLSTYITSHLSRPSQRRILEQLSRFRPKFRAAMQGLTDMQLVLVEMWFERSLMEYDRVFASMAIPACCWRRTGEIFRGNREMAELIGVGVERLRDGRLAIHEILAEESLVSYWEKFGAIAFDGSQKAILTSCSLKSPGEEGEGKGRKKSVEGGGVGVGKGKEGKEVRCCFSFTIRRDSHNM